VPLRVMRPVGTNRLIRQSMTCDACQTRAPNMQSTVTAQAMVARRRFPSARMKGLTNALIEAVVDDRPISQPRIGVGAQR
jgi:hypothetical protein